MAALNIVILTEANFEHEVLNSPTPVLVDFWAEWCGPCKMIAPILDELASEYDGKVKVGKVNIDEYQSIATQYGIRAIPTLLIFKDGEVAELWYAGTRLLPTTMESARSTTPTRAATKKADISVVLPPRYLTGTAAFNYMSRRFFG